MKRRRKRLTKLERFQRQMENQHRALTIKALQTPEVVYIPTVHMREYGESDAEFTQRIRSTMGGKW